MLKSKSGIIVCKRKALISICAAQAFFFQMVNSASEVQEGTILEVVINTQPLGKII
jgi:hypothetical protein